MSIGRITAGIILIAVLCTVLVRIRQRKKITPKDVFAIAEKWSYAVSGVLLLCLGFIPPMISEVRLFHIVDELSLVFVVTGVLLLLPTCNKFADRKARRKPAVKPQIIQPVGIPSEEAVGTPTITQGAPPESTPGPIRP